MLGVDPEVVNVNGGAVALGHPIGASGGRILSTMIYELRRNGGGLGLAANLSGGGQGDGSLDRGLTTSIRLRYGARRRERGRAVARIDVGVAGRGAPDSARGGGCAIATRISPAGR